MQPSPHPCYLTPPRAKYFPHHAPPMIPPSKREATFHACTKQHKIRLYSYSRTNMMHVSQMIYSGETLYMFQTVFPSIIRSSRLHIQQQAYVKVLLLPAASGDEMCLNSTHRIHSYVESAPITILTTIITPPPSGRGFRQE
jgi:hypothetical protein